MTNISIKQASKQAVMTRKMLLNLQDEVKLLRERKQASETREANLRFERDKLLRIIEITIQLIVFKQKTTVKQKKQPSNRKHLLDK